jgi:hypothetical protein
MDMSAQHPDRPRFEARHMSIETSKRRIVEAERLPETTFVHPDQPVLAESELASEPVPEKPLDLNAFGKLRTLFELLDAWDQKEKADEE